MNINFKYLLLAFILFSLSQGLVWVQSFAQFYFPKLKYGINPYLLILLSLPAGAGFIYGTKLGGIAFNYQAWPLRFVSFGAGIIIFAFLTNYFGQEGINLKTLVSLILAVMILAIQILWK